MTIHAALTHRTTYRYDRPISLGPQVVRLRPAPHCRTPILSYALKIEPPHHFINWQQDPFGNWLARLVFQDRTDHFEVAVDLVARMDAINPFDFFFEESAEEVPFTYEPDLAKDLAPYFEITERGERLSAFIESLPKQEMRSIDFFVEVNRRIEAEIGYIIRMEPGVQTPEHTLTIGKGSCRDSAWLQVQVLRHLGYAARFVSGYLIQLTADEKPVDGPAGPEADFTDLHAWAEVYAPGAGWIGLDATSGLLAGEGHIPLAATPAPQSAAPISGSLEEAEVEFEFDMQVRRIYETPRVTLPYTDEQWSIIEGTGRKIDEMLVAGDVRLTVGGEPTFVSASDRDAGEWNIDAVGPTKRFYADELIRRLRTRFAPNGLLHYGQGKWYPGEQLPRWAFALYWRQDGEPMWGDPALIADESMDVSAGIAEAEVFMTHLCEALEIDPAHALPAFEDTGEFLLKEHQLPPNLDPENNKLEDAQERARMARVFDRGLTTAVSMVLPIQAAQARATSGRRRYRWRSEPWQTRRGHLFLLPGDSPAGFRLPLHSLGYLRPVDYPDVIPLDPFAARAALPSRRPRFQEARPRPPAPVPPAGPIWVNPALAVRTAITVEPRGGVLCVFLPPVNSVDEYVDLVHALEEAAAAAGQPIHIEGYEPPPDYRLNLIKVTPDPGVIEVNVHPAHSWQEQVEITEILYEEARYTGLDASKFEVDGKPTGSGGGNHIVVGGATPADSPFLRRPDLLGSLIRYWQNHPSLSYLFSGMFIGPTSQAPRVDEARHESLYELEIALSQIPSPDNASGVETPPWLVDRIFRHLLVDVSGNTHRSEICIDKLYSPDGPTGRLGLVEFRAFEMPPHPLMSLAQQLVLRALIARFWKTPYVAPLHRFGTALHDKYMLPHFVWNDFVEVLSETSAALGLTLDANWFTPHFEWRFPVYGAVRHAGLDIELRRALEPWHVLGEEGIVGGTARFVDSTLDRLQVRVTGDLERRYSVTCNGIELPLQQTDRYDERISGVRFRTSLLPSALHPTIWPHGPLIFDVVDSRNNRSVGGCTYHTQHPGGRNPEDRPVNALEAQGRMLARFDPNGHTPGPFTVRRSSVNPDYPYTLDLRRF